MHALLIKTQPDWIKLVYCNNSRTIRVLCHYDRAKQKNLDRSVWPFYCKPLMPRSTQQYALLAMVKVAGYGGIRIYHYITAMSPMTDFNDNIISRDMDMSDPALIEQIWVWIQRSYDAIQK